VPFEGIACLRASILASPPSLSAAGLRRRPKRGAVALFGADCYGSPHGNSRRCGSAGWCLRGMTMVLVTHEMGFARRSADTIVFMHRGRIWEKGPPSKLFGAPATAELVSFIDAILFVDPSTRWRVG
jgi:hypothetical protein